MVTSSSVWHPLQHCLYTPRLQNLSTNSGIGPAHKQSCSAFWRPGRFLRISLLARKWCRWNSEELHHVLLLPPYITKTAPRETLPTANHTSTMSGWLHSFLESLLNPHTRTLSFPVPVKTDEGVGPWLRLWGASEGVSLEPLRLGQWGMAHGLCDWDTVHLQSPNQR